MTETLVGQFPKHIGSTGGLLNSAETEEKYAIVWNSYSIQLHIFLLFLLSLINHQYFLYALEIDQLKFQSS